MPDASVMIAYEEYKNSDGTIHKSRLDSTRMEWNIIAKNGKTYYIKFEGGFAKKHLYTSMKKQDKVRAAAKELWVEKGHSAESWNGECIDEAQKSLDEAKFKRQIGHRSLAERKKYCNNCGHPIEKHKTGSGKLRTGCTHPCPCTGWSESPTIPYEDYRRAKGVPPEKLDPMQEPHTNINTFIWLNMIDESLFRQVVSDSIIKKEKDLGRDNPAWADRNGVFLDWDFGEQNRGCVICFTKEQAFADWTQRSAVQVSARRKNPFDPDKPTYTIFHLEKLL